MSLELNDVLVFLRSKHIKMSPSNEWLKECCDFYKSSNPNVNTEELQNFVYEQWLLADLCDIGEQCLPSFITNSSKCVLEGNFAVQVNEILNIGESCYSQLKSIRTSGSISTFCESEEKTQSWEPKHNRTLRLNLTDGALKLTAMEFELIRALKEPFIPGFKILLLGPIECRKGVLLLKSRSVQILGGEADSLLINHATENILARKLNLDLNPDPFNRQSSPPQSDAEEEFIDQATDPQDSGFNSCFNQNESVEHSTFSNEVTSIPSNNNRDVGFRSSSHSNWPPTSSTTRYSSSMRRASDDHTLDSIRRERSPIIGVATPITSNKRNAESPPPHLNISSKSTKTNAETKIPACTSSYESRTSKKSTTAVSTIGDLQNLISRKSFGCVDCTAKITKLITKPRIKNDRWHVTAEIEDHTGRIQIAFSDSFLHHKIFKLSAFEILSQKERMATNPAVREQVDEMLKNGVQDILTLQGQFRVQITSDNELPVIVDVK